MARYRRIPEIVEAVQWFKHGDHPAVHRTAYDEVPGFKKAIVVPPDHPSGYLDTLNGRQCITAGDWIILDEQGQVWAMGADEFLCDFEPDPSGA
jgi:hypothetical protein